MIFKYKAINSKGEIVNGFVEAENKRDGLIKLKETEGIIAMISFKRRANQSSRLINLEKRIYEIERKNKEKKEKKEKEKEEKKREEREKIKRGEYGGRRGINIDLSKIFTISSSKKGGSLPQEQVSVDRSHNYVDRNDILAIARDTEKGEEIDPVIITKANKVKSKKNLNDGKEIDWESIEINIEENEQIKKNMKIKVKDQEIILFTKKLSVMLSSGVSLMRALTILRDSASKNMANVLNGVITSIQKGNSFSSSLALYPRQFNNVYVSLISIGENSGSLNKSLNDVVYYLEKNNNIKKKVKSASIYPSVIAVVLVALLIGASVFFIPTFEKMFAEQGQVLPQLTLIVFTLTDFIPFIMLFLFLSFIILRYLVKHNKKVNMYYHKTVDLWMFKIPVLKNVINASYMFTISSTLSLMLENGIKIKDAIKLCQKSINNVYVKNELSSTSNLMLQGFTFSEALELQPHIDPLLANIALTGEESGKMSFALKEISEYYDGELNRLIGTLMELVQPVFVLLIGLVIAPILIAIYMPIFSISSGGALGL